MQDSKENRQALIEKVTRNKAGHLVIRVRGQSEPVRDASVSRCFPWSLPDGYISVRDKQGHEITLLKTLDELDPISRKVIEEELRDKVFNPRILRVLEHERVFGVTSITAITDRGQVTFQMMSRDDIRVLSKTRALFRDADGNIYELADLTKLDSRSRKYLRDYF